MKSKNLVDVQELVARIDGHVVIKMDPAFPGYEPGDDLDLIVMDRESALRTVWDFHNEQLLDRAELRVTDDGPHCHADFFVAGELDFRVDLLDTLEFFSKFEVRPSFVTKILRDRVPWGKGDRIFVPAPEDELALRYFEFLEYFDRRPDKIKHLDYICDVAEAGLKAAFLDNAHRYVRFRRHHWQGELRDLAEVASTVDSEARQDLAAIWGQLPQQLDLPACATVVEVGTFRLEEARAALPQMSDPRWYVLEPDPRNAAHIRRTIEQSGLDGRVFLTESAAGTSSGSTVLYLSSGKPPDAPEDAEEWSASSSMKKPGGILQGWPWMRFDQQIEVPIVRLDAFCAKNRIDHIDLLRVNGHGSEEEILAGAGDMLTKTHYIATSHSYTGQYEGAASLSEQMSVLPDGWQIRERFQYDTLLENTRFLAET